MGDARDQNLGKIQKFVWADVGSQQMLDYLGLLYG